MGLLFVAGGETESASVVIVELVCFGWAHLHAAANSPRTDDEHIVQR